MIYKYNKTIPYKSTHDNHNCQESILSERHFFPVQYDRVDVAVDVLRTLTDPWQLWVPGVRWFCCCRGVAVRSVESAAVVAERLAFLTQVLGVHLGLVTAGAIATPLRLLQWSLQNGKGTEVTGREGVRGSRRVSRAEDEDGGGGSCWLVHSATVDAQWLALLTQVLWVHFALVTHVQSVGFLQGALKQQIPRWAAWRAAHWGARGRGAGLQAW